MSEISKQALLEWLARMSLMYHEYGYENHLYALNAVTYEIESGTFDTDQGEVQRLRAALEQIEDESSREDACITQINGIAQEALSTEPTGEERVRESKCPHHPETKVESSSSHTYTQDGNTYFKSQVKYCSTCYHVINTDAWL